MMVDEIIDLCSGCGGFSLGAEEAGFSTSFAIDIDQDLNSSYKMNFPSTQVITSDISLLTKEFWRDHLNGRKPAGVIGGPPCQGFSRIGKRNRSDPRNTVINHFFNQVMIIQPKFFVMENVDGLLDEGNVDILMSALEVVSKKYTVIDPMIVDASKYGAATERRRVMVIGYDRNEMEPIGTNLFSPPTKHQRTTVSDAIRDLPEPSGAGGYSTDLGWAKYPEIEGLSISGYAAKLRKAPPPERGWNYAKKMLQEGYVSGLAATTHSQIVRERFSNTPEGSEEPISRYPRLSWDSCCPTLRAGTGKDRGSFQAVRPIHPSEPRVITVREAARLQGFPDWFIFHKTKLHSFRMIGNSVSPIVSHTIMKYIKQKISMKAAA